MTPMSCNHNPQPTTPTIQIESIITYQDMIEVLFNFYLSNLKGLMKVATEELNKSLWKVSGEEFLSVLEVIVLLMQTRISHLLCNDLIQDDLYKDARRRHSRQMTTPTSISIYLCCGKYRTFIEVLELGTYWRHTIHYTLRIRF